MKSYSEYRAQARETLHGAWNESAVLFLIIMIVPLILSGVSGLIPPCKQVLLYSISGLSVAVSLLLTTPLQYGAINSLLQLTRGESNGVLRDGLNLFCKDYSRNVPAIFLSFLAELGLGLVTLFIGAVILEYAYAMVPYLLRDYPELTTKEALRTSREMMRGHKWDLFVLDLTFLGWYLLGILTLGIAYLWVMPYQHTARAHFYEDLKAATIVEE